MKQYYFHSLLTTFSVSGNFCQKVELFDFSVDSGNLVRAWLEGSKMGVWSEDRGGIKSSGCHI